MQPVSNQLYLIDIRNIIEGDHGKTQTGLT
jgi:hypothetical protein